MKVKGIIWWNAASVRAHGGSLVRSFEGAFIPEGTVWPQVFSNLCLKCKPLVINVGRTHFELGDISSTPFLESMYFS